MWSGGYGAIEATKHLFDGHKRTELVPLIMEKNLKKPKALKDMHLKFLDALRDNGKINMFGAPPYLMKAYESLSEDDARSIVAYWMKTYGDRHKQDD